MSQDDRMRPLRAEVECELLSLASLVPLIVSNLRAPFSPQLTCTDASPAGGATSVADSRRQLQPHVDAAVVPNQKLCVGCSSILAWSADPLHLRRSCQRGFCSLRCYFFALDELRNLPNIGYLSGTLDITTMVLFEIVCP